MMSTEPKITKQPEVHHSPVKKGHFKRRFLLTLGPVVVAVVTAYMYWTGGRFISTDNAYIQADRVAVSADVSGSIVALLVAENDYVEQGQPLFKIDSRAYVIALELARSRLQQALTDIQIQKGRYRQKSNELKLAQSNIDFSRKEFVRQSTLELNQAVAKAKLDDARHNLDVSQYRFAIIKNEMDQILASLEGNPEIDADQLASYRLAQAAVEKAALELEKTLILAPFSGQVSKIPQIGKHVEPGTPVMSLIANSGFWIEANLKETELTHVHPGQKVDIEVDTYPGQKFTGTVQSISPGTGSEFSIIPAQNATGNWVKVVQRVPVRIRVDDHSAQQVLRSGMSTQVQIDTEYNRPLPILVQKALAAIGINRNAMAAQGNKQ
jgi:membrane fusion protein, multidrug efflux system